jgi:DNA-nicking Smr family endonuclease
MSKRKAQRSLTAEEAELWRLVAETIRPLAVRHRKHRNVPVTESGVEPEPVAPPKPKRRIAAAPPPLPRPAAPPKPPALVVGDRADMDKRKAEKFRKGDLPIDGRIDLHHHTQEEAHRALDRFVVASHAAGKRCLLVITGKGRAGGVGILREMVPRWLNEAPLRSKVLAIESARNRHGGSGAYYVLLRRMR